MNELLRLSFLKSFFDTKIATIFDLHNNCDKQANLATMSRFYSILTDKKVRFQNNAAYYYLEINIFQPTCFGRKEFEICCLFVLILSTDNRIFFSQKLRRANTYPGYECMIVSSQ